MATFRKRSGRWQVQVRRMEGAHVSRTFSSRRDAERWARDVECRIEQSRSPYAPPRRRQEPTFAALLTRYQEEVSPTKKSATVERYRIGALMRHTLVQFPVNQLTAEVIAAYRDERLRSVSGETVRQDLVLIHQVIETARREWGVSLIANPASEVRKPKSAQGRARRLANGEATRLSATLSVLRNPVVRDVAEFALATGMRRGEILRIVWRNVDWPRRIVLVEQAKNGHSRHVPISGVALRILLRRRRANANGDLDTAFPVSANAVRLAWQRIKKKGALADLRFHDLRHEAISRFFESGLSLPEVALISGHRDPRMLLRYTHLDAARIAEKLNKVC